MERRVARLETASQGDTTTIKQASYSVQAALERPSLDRDETAAWAERIRTSHPLDEHGLQRAVALAYRRVGVPPEQAARLATIPLETLMSIASTVARELDVPPAEE